MPSACPTDIRLSIRKQPLPHLKIDATFRITLLFVGTCKPIFISVILRDAPEFQPTITQYEFLGLSCGYCWCSGNCRRR